jgi:hypothetical protein
MYEVSPMCPKAHTALRSRSLFHKRRVDTLVDTATIETERHVTLRYGTAMTAESLVRCPGDAGGTESDTRPRAR